jgi:DNA (cytosine-5)-methyltransferase 1
MKIKAIDFFCGAGGLTRGLLDAGLDVLAGVDNDKRLRETYENNNKPSKFICQDIRKTNIRKLRRQLGISGKDKVLYAACTPCQPFSTLNRMEGHDKRRSLLNEFAKLVKESPPDFILVENVPGLNTAFGKRIFARFRNVLKDCGFDSVYADFLDAHDYGVPQTRKRFILLASRVGRIRKPRRVYPRPTVRKCIKKYPRIADGGASDRFLNHVARPLGLHHKRIVQAIPKDGGSRRDIIDTSILLKCHRESPKAHKDVFGRMAWDEPAPTLTCRCTDVYCGRFVHPQQDRGISLREAAALQTFRDDYKFYGKFILQMSRQIGNAVPVRFAAQLGKAILKSASQS